MNVLERFRLDGRTAVVTGGSRGLGLEMARGLAEAGADLIIVGRDEATLSTAQQALGETGRIVMAVAGDLGTAEGADSVCSRILALGREIDVLINNVGGRRLDVSLEETAIEDWRKFFDLNLNSALICCQQLGRPMLARGHGSIVNVSSIAGPIAIKGIGGRHYEASKAALTAMTKSLAADWAGRGVRVNAIAPGVFETAPNREWFGRKPEFRQTFLDHIPMNRLGQPEEIAPAAVFLASDASSYLTGTVLVVDGGFTCW
jgi:NAD(P)-dependent dehydrogenase (short-subunit alcohol dehydrogenase family)